MVTVKECERVQRRSLDHYGNRYPYKGRYYGADMVLPNGWRLIHIPTWGIHIRRDGDTDYMEDL